jgi:hypothetical protein
MSPRRRVTGIYGKPILGEGNLHADPAKVLRSLKYQLNLRLKKKLEGLITHPAYSAKVKAKIAKSLQIHVKKSSLVLTTNFAGFFPLLYGSKAHQMTWLTKAKRPIPIKLEDGTTIFRWATGASMLHNSWWHPGYRPTTLIDKAKKETREFVKARLAAEVMKQLKGVLTGK